MDQTKVSWETFKATDEFSCTNSKCCLLQFSKFEILLLNMSFREKSMWNNYRFFEKKTTKHYHYLNNKNKCQHTLIFHSKNDILENISENKNSLALHLHFLFHSFYFKIVFERRIRSEHLLQASNRIFFSSFGLREPVLLPTLPMGSIYLKVHWRIVNLKKSNSVCWCMKSLHY